jgi:hypothetical protein
VGDFHIERSGLRFSFLTALPGGLSGFWMRTLDDCTSHMQCAVAQENIQIGDWARAAVPDVRIVLARVTSLAAVVFLTVA